MPETKAITVSGALSAGHQRSAASEKDYVLGTHDEEICTARLTAPRLARPGSRGLAVGRNWARSYGA